MRGVMIAALLLSAAPAFAVALPAGAWTPLPGTTAAARPELAGLVIADRVVPFTLATGTGSFSGTVQQRVVRSDADGTLDFYWRVTNDAGSDAGIDLVRIGGFGAHVADGDWRIDGLGDVAPAEAFNFGTGEAVFAFDRPAGTPPGSSSRFFFLRTAATRFADTGSMDVTGYRETRGGADFVYSGLIDTYAPAAVPEPGAWTLMIGGFGMVGATLRRRRAAAAT